MAEGFPTESSSGAATTSREADRSQGGAPAGPLQTSQGKTTIANTVVTKVAGIAAREVRGVHELGGDIGRAVAGVTQRVGVGDQATQGVSVEVGEREAAIDLTVVIDYGESIPQVSQALRDNVIKRIEGITGLSVTEVNVSVNDLYSPGDETPDEPARVA